MPCGMTQSGPLNFFIAVAKTSEFATDKKARFTRVDLLAWNKYLSGDLFLLFDLMSNQCYAEPLLKQQR